MHLGLILVAFLVTGSEIALSQETGPCVDADKYPEPEPVGLVETGPLVLQRVAGRAVIKAGGKIMPGSELCGGACLSLFTANSHKFVAHVQLDKQGLFEFGRVPPGDYRLVARAPGFCTGNDPVRIKASRARGKRRVMIVYFQPHEIDTCTTVDYDGK
jgi:hypothetical protein